MGLFNKIKEPVFLKEDSALPKQLAALEELRESAPPDIAKKLEQEIRNVHAGLIGEQKIAFELKNSHIPMYVLHDLYLEFDGLAAQIDYLVLTRRRNFIIECKNLYGNIEITAQGDFIRKIGYNGKSFKERIYSPITQNERHLALIKQILSAQRTNILTQTLFERSFASNYRSVVVFANPKTVLKDKFSEKDAKTQVIPADRLIAYIKQVNAEKGAEDGFEKNMTELAHFFLEIAKPAPDYIEKYCTLFGANMPAEKKKMMLLRSSREAIVCPACGAAMVLRTATKGSNAGNAFYGCSRFPECRKIVNID